MSILFIYCCLFYKFVATLKNQDVDVGSFVDGTTPRRLKTKIMGLTILFNGHNFLFRIAKDII